MKMTYSNELQDDLPKEPDSGGKIKLSVLELGMMWQGLSAGEAIQNAVDLARHVEQLGYTRFWFSEHHNSANLASSAPEILIGHVAGATSTLRVGSGGVMLPNHSSLKVVENFRTLEAIYPQRIDLGIGRAPGTDGLTAYALRRSREALSVEDFPEQLAELLAFFSNSFPPGHNFNRITPTPVVTTIPEIWMLGSSDAGGRFAAQNGLGFAFAHHISPEPALPVLRFYRQQFQPSKFLAAPRSILAASVICAETDEEAEDLAAPQILNWVRFAQGLHLPPPTLEEARNHRYTPGEEAIRQQTRSRGIIGSVERVMYKLERLIKDGQVDELMVLTMIPDPAARRRSYELLAKAFGKVASSQ
jgi:luciferase family oxidoreductase group 1